VIALSILLFAFQYHYIVKYEEGLLFEAFGEKYQSFCQDVPPWFPRKKLALEGLEWPDTFSPAIRSEQKTLMTIVTVIVILAILA
jgi:hypothetical protein